MATRRPKVPRVTPATRQPETDSGGGDVILADFGGRKHGETGRETAAQAGGTGPARSSGAAHGAAPAASDQGSGTSRAKAAAQGTAKTTAPGKPTAAKGTAPGETAPGKAGGAAAAAAGKKRSGSSPVNGEDESLDPIPAKAFSGRMLALAVVMIAITIMLAPTVKIFIDKRAEIAALEADIAAKQSAQDDLKRQVSRWQDPNYVKQQARDRINMVMPGETGYWVFGSDMPAGAAASDPGAAAVQDPANVPWVDSLWESIRRSATD
ncbi:septum formation initiator family protein [Arthrobacter sp. NPDC093125]|uniref:FtsB family cell division protein n=1 Tax=Arthrobacter sp. NPDC093125 TaxID=3363944 RepID=UPI00382F89F1